MVNHAKLSICFGVLLAILSTGCAGTGGLRGSVAGQQNKNSSLSTRKRMMVIAKTYEEQGHKARAVNAYRQVFKQYPRSSQAKQARQRIFALNGSKKQKDQPLATEKTLLADSVPVPEKEQPETQTAEKESQVEAQPFPELLPTLPSPAPAKLLVDNKKPKQSKNNVDENAAWPEWSHHKIAGLGTPSLSSPEVAKEELLLPPAASESKHAEKLEEGSLLAKVADKTPLLPVPTPIPERESDGIHLSQNAEPNHDKQANLNQRLATLSYLIGEEESITEDVVKSLKLLLRHDDYHIKINSAEALFKQGYGNEEAMAAIANALTCEEESIRIVGIHALVSAYKQSPEKTLQLMIDELEQDTPAVQHQVALLLGDFRNHSETVIPMLEQLISHHENQQVRDAAQLSLVCLKN